MLSVLGFAGPDLLRCIATCVPQQKSCDLPRKERLLRCGRARIETGITELISLSFEFDIGEREQHRAESRVHQGFSPSLLLAG
jgi:hypothetical protein